MLRLIVAVLAGKTAYLVSRIFGYGGSSLPGKVARMVDPAVLRKLAAQAGDGIIVVCGTNGKSTTVAMISKALERAGHKVAVNWEGANMITGVTAAFVRNTGFLGRMDCTYAVLEVDEASVPGVVEELTPNLVVVTNFFYDQMDRYGDQNHLIKIIADSLTHKKTTLALNGDDPLVAQLASRTGLSAIYYGMAAPSAEDSASSQGKSAVFCPLCGSLLEYRYYHYGHLGAYHCPGCSFSRPDPLVEAGEAALKDGTYDFKLSIDRKQVKKSLIAKGKYNIFNTLAAVTAGVHFGVNREALLLSIEEFKPVTGRMETFDYNNKKVNIMLVKNAAGFIQAVSFLREEQGSVDLFIALNDQVADGRDISWLWDVGFETLAHGNCSFGQIICSGRRGEDVAVRLKYAGLPPEIIAANQDLNKAVTDTLNGNATAVYLLSNYTPLLQVHKVVKSTVG